MKKHMLKRFFSVPSDGIATLVTVTLLTIFLLAIIIPLIWMCISAFKSTNEIFTNIWGLPEKWLVSNYITAWNTGIAKYFMNSVLVTVSTVALNLIVCSLMAFTLSINKICFKAFFTMLAVMGMMFSPIVSMFPLYQEIQTLGLYNKRLSLILVYTAYQIPMSFMVIYAFFRNIDKSYLDAARIDGARDMTILFKVFVPLSASIFMVSVVLTGFYAWNEFSFALVFVKEDALKTIPVGLLAFQGEMYSDWGVLLAGLVISALPLILLFIFAQKYFVAGLSAGGVKG